MLYKGVALLSLAAVLAGAADVTGSVSVTRRLTKRRLPGAANGYYRGPAAAPAETAEGDFVTRELDRVAVYIEGDGPRGAVEASLVQERRQFSTDVVAVPVGSTVSFPNRDPLFHNVFSLSPAKNFDLGNYPQGQSRSVRFDKPGVVSVHCHLHSNMSASIVVAPNRWVVKPSADGRFSIKDVAPGKYRVAAWHRSAGVFRKDVVVNASGGEISFTIPVDGAEPR